jgi:hypothetical protein
METDGTVAAGVHEISCDPPGHETVSGLQVPQAQVKGMPEPPPVVFGAMLSIWMGMLQVVWQAAPPQEALKTAV